MAARQKIEGVQALRAVAALSVVLQHVAEAAAKDLDAPTAMLGLQQAGLGVDLFFVISGFVILYAHNRDTQTTQAAGRYLWRRFARVIPPVFLIATGWALLVLVTNGLGFTDIYMTLRVWVSSAFVLPMLEPPNPLVIWSLRHEVLFYLIFLTFYISPKLFIGALAVWVVACTLPSSLHDPFVVIVEDDIFRATLLAPINMLFAFGGLAFLAMRHLDETPIWPWLIAGAGGVAVVMFAEKPLWLEYPVIGATCVALVMSVGRMPFRGLLGKALEELGNASYALYLIHPIVISVVARLFADAIGSPALFVVILVLLSIASALVWYRLIERPLTMWLRSPSWLPYVSKPSRT
ncbi:acyltransferase family protein [Pseudoroseicyclus sp. CXY001]|uniref:acyltransferase family protein n=1 Tax=Pseudoroseicyclus sp. CXY001 TaxID=3242492 RepID=UPI0035711910